MPRYLLSFYQPQGDIPPREVLEPMMRELDSLKRDLQAGGEWVFAGGLHPPSTATIVRFKDDEILITDGPFAEGKEFLGGVTVIDVPDLDAALAWAAKYSRTTTLPIEVRPFNEAPR
ncbi:MAG TPA: YciI family protein [Gemmatimonadaceae bacterium]|nr:YciI family protein [Gemmatimonadaceae bacterium]